MVTVAGVAIHEIAKDLTGLGVPVPAHATGEQPVEPARDHEQRHVEVHLEADGGESASM